MPKTLFDLPKKKIIRKKIKDQKERQAQAYLRARRNKQIEKAQERKNKRDVGKRSR